MRQVKHLISGHQFQVVCRHILRSAPLVIVCRGSHGEVVVRILDLCLHQGVVGRRQKLDSQSTLLLLFPPAHPHPDLCAFKEQGTWRSILFHDSVLTFKPSLPNWDFTTSFLLCYSSHLWGSAPHSFIHLFNWHLWKAYALHFAKCQGDKACVSHRKSSV